MSISDRLDQIEARADAATDGPWHEGPGMTFVRARVIYDMVTDDAQVATSHVLADVTRNHDAEFIAASRTDVPAMLAALRAVLDLHKPEGWGDDHLTCSTCWSPAIDGLRLYPCPTVRAVQAALGEVQQ